jgi:hypothetical protein
MQRSQDITDPQGKRFYEALETLQAGKIPENMSFVVGYIKQTTREFTDYATAVTECCYRLANQNKLLRELISKLEASVRRKLGMGVDSKPLDFGKILEWYQRAAEDAVADGREDDAAMLLAGVELVLKAGGGES